jgi:hypothetical protein
MTVTQSDGQFDSLWKRAPGGIFTNPLSETSMKANNPGTGL